MSDSTPHSEPDFREVSLELRNWADNRERLNLDPSLLRAAADEIDQLRSEIDRLGETHEEKRLMWEASAPATSPREDA